MTNHFIGKLAALEPTLSEADVKVLASVTSSPHRYARHRDLIREGDRPEAMLVVLSGWACRYKLLPTGSRQITGFLMPGDACDLHNGVLAEMDHSIQALTDVEIAAIPGNLIQSELLSRPTIANALYRSQLIDEGTLRAWIVSIGRRTSLERISHLMCELFIRGRNIGLASGLSMKIPLSQSTLADALGLTPVHVNRVLKVLKDEGVMTLNRGSLQIDNADRLARIAGFDDNYLHRRLRAA